MIQETQLTPELDGLRIIASDSDHSPTLHIIWLHGLGASGNDFADLAEVLVAKSNSRIAVTLPHAPIRPITINGGMPMRAWFDWQDPTDPWKGVKDTREDSFNLLSALLEKESVRCPEATLLLGGFSQGGAIALETGLRTHLPIAGIFALSCWLLRKTDEGEEQPIHNRPSSIFQAHGDEDVILPLRLGKWTRQRLEDLDLPVEWHAYPMAHSLCDEEVQHLANWFSQFLR